MQLINDIKQILNAAKKNAYQEINRAMVCAYWLIGKRIVQEEQQGKSRAAYGESVIKNLSEILQKEFGKGFSQRNLKQMRLFYIEYQIPQTVSAKSWKDEKNESNFNNLGGHNFKLSWSHYLFLLLPVLSSFSGV